MVSSKEARQARKIERARKASATSNYKSRKRVEQRNTSVLVIIVSVVCVSLMAAAVWNKKFNTPDTHPSASPTAAPTEIVPNDPAAEPGKAVASTITPSVAKTPVACGGKEPANAAEARNTYPGGPAQVLEAGKDYVAEIETSCGPIVMDLLEQETPITSNSFAFLAEQHFFDGLEIFRNATTIGALQTGSGTNVADWSSGYKIPDELAVAKQGYALGDVSMANAGPNTAGSQFFFIYNDKFGLPPAYATFGHVINGFDALEKIGAIAAEGETPTERVYMEKVTIREKTDADKTLGEAADAKRADAIKRTQETAKVMQEQAKAAQEAAAKQASASPAPEAQAEDAKADSDAKADDKADDKAGDKADAKADDKAKDDAKAAESQGDATKAEDAKAEDKPDDAKASEDKAAEAEAGDAKADEKK